MGAVLVFSAILTLPGETCASVTYGAQIIHQQNETNNGAISNTTTQDKFSFFFTMNTRPSSRLSLTGDFRFDVLYNVNKPGGDSTEIQPNINVTLSTRALQTTAGYREILRDESIIAGNVTKSLQSDSTELFLDNAIHAGKLPDLRIRYSRRNEMQSTDGAKTIDNATNELRASLNYRLGIFSVNADYLTQATKDKLAGNDTDTVQFTGEASMVKNLGSKINVSFRENYNFNETLTAGVDTTKSFNSITEGRLNVIPFRGAIVGTNYIYRVSDDILDGLNATTEKTWFTSANYSLPKFLRFYGSYSTRTLDSPTSLDTDDVTIAGLNFSHQVGRVSIAARYERWLENASTTTAGALTEHKTTRDSLDWIISSLMGKYMRLDLSESYLANTVDSLTTKSNRFRLKANMGPIKNFLAAPSIDYVIDTATDGTETVTTQIVVPASFRVDLHKRLVLTMTDSFQLTTIDTGGLSSTSQTNSAVVRVDLLRPLPGTNLSADATFASSSTSGGTATATSTTTSTYTVRADWFKVPHSLNASVRYQTGTNLAPTMDLLFQYGLDVRLKKLSLNLQARYGYSIIMATSTVPESTAQSIYLVLNLRK